jgi:hypothetical protein
MPTTFLLIFVGTLIMLRAMDDEVCCNASSDFWRFPRAVADVQEADEEAGSTSISVLARSSVNGERNSRRVQ